MALQRGSRHPGLTRWGKGEAVGVVGAEARILCKYLVCRNTITVSRVWHSLSLSILEMNQDPYGIVEST